MTSSEAKDLFIGIWVFAFVLGFVLRLAGIDDWGALEWVVGLVLIACGGAIVGFWMREQRRAEGGLRRALAPWLWSLAAIFAIGGLYALLLELL